MSDDEARKELLFLIKPYKSKLAFITVFLIISTLISIIQPLLNRKMIDEGFIEGNFNKVFFNVVCVLILVVVDKTINVLKEKIRAGICVDLKFKLYDRYFCKLVKMKISNFNF